MNKFYSLLLILFFSGCATLGVMEYDKLYGESNINNRLSIPAMTKQQQSHFSEKIQPIIENRCVVCHGCYDAPCQLKLESRAGLERGASKKRVYNGERLLTAKDNHSLSTLTKLNRNTLSEMRKEGFFSVLNERQQTPIANKNAGLIYQMLQLKQQHPLPETPLLDNSFDVSLDRSQQCPTIEEFEQYKTKYPLAGMPYALPALTAEQHTTLTTWLENGALLPNTKPLNASEISIIAQWEAWLNSTTNKQQLVSRYLYEHLYLANLFFQQPNSNYFKLVRSTTPPGQPIKLINSRRPFDAPFSNKGNNEESPQVYYRLQKNNDTIIAKRHMPYRFDLAKLAYLDELFIAPDYPVETLPDYQLKNAANPFITFKAIPAKSRYLFLLEQAQFSIMNFIKGPVCRGQVALNVIEDHFWVFFADPSYINHYHSDGFIDNNTELLQLPASTSDKALSVLYWRSYASRQQSYLENKLHFMKEIGFRQSDLDLELVWPGNGNPNATLTVFRHFDSASVLQGFVGQTPKTAWFITYPLLERIHYLLVAGFDVYGNVAHQLKTRLYMDFLRMEAESNFIALLPKKDRRSIHEYWYRGTSDTIKDYIFSDDFEQLPETNIHYKTKQPQQELLQLIAQHTANETSNDYSLSNGKNNRYDYKLQRLNNKKGVGVSILPQISYLMVSGEQGDSVYTLINNSAHSNVAHLFSENDRRLPEEDTLTVVTGIVGTYPNAFFHVKETQLGDFVSSVELMQTPADYRQLKDTYAVRRTSKNFWQYADKLHAWYKTNRPNEAGLLDFNRLENR
ncbi:MAG: fatty acid cis/trans isomerase [Colwellia sp.]|nr:fatty acid cis/trans isomerase [Colwellia sp.]MCW8865834.1 fatty acid cis/trans isomerase [Colwellia sp.]MCW9082172.1 fatty acid cis/trans isomerase [Colwellia sp.]